nr:type II toxin-antitoxin system VapB family antitoxin [Polymorphobacter sp.]
MHLNIKNDETHALASRLAAATGESLTQAVTEAVRDRLLKVERGQSLEARRAKVQALAASIRARQPKPLPTQAEMDSWFYDEDGLPK